MRQTMIDVVKSFERHAPGHQYLYHDLHASVTAPLRAIRFDLVVLDSTFLDARVIRPIERFTRLRSRYEFVRASDAVKVALTQDEFDNGRTLDDWLADWRVDRVLPCVAPDTWDLIFPRTRAIAGFQPCFTGFFDPDRAAARRASVGPLASRPIDIGCRVARLPPEFGRFGLAKAALADAVAARFAGTAVHCDISTDPARMFLGDSWSAFLAGCKFSLGSEGGSSVWDPDGAIRQRVRDHVARHPGAGRDDIEAACFPGVDGQHVFRVMSPRVFEAASQMTSQILVRGDYGGLVREWDHYIPVAADFSNLDEVADAIADVAAAERRARDCFDALAAQPRAHARTFARDVIERAACEVERRGLRGTPAARFAELAAAHRRASWPDRVGRVASSLLARVGRLRLGRVLPAGVKDRLRERLGL